MDLQGCGVHCPGGGNRLIGLERERAICFAPRYSEQPGEGKGGVIVSAGSGKTAYMVRRDLGQLVQKKKKKKT